MDTCGPAERSGVLAASLSRRAPSRVSLCTRVPLPVSVYACVCARWVLGLGLVLVGVFFFPFFFPLACSRFYFWLPVRVLLLPSEILY